MFRLLALGTKFLYKSKYSIVRSDVCCVLIGTTVHLSKGSPMDVTGGADSLEGDVTELFLGKDFEDATALSNAEVAIIMKQYQANQKKEGKDVSNVFERTLSCAKRFSGTKDPVDNVAAVTELRKALQGARFTVEGEDGIEVNVGLEPYEVIALANMTPETVEEAMTLIPSLGSRFTEVDVEELLNILRQNT